MLKPAQLQRLMFLFAMAGLFAVTADFACLQDVCAEKRTGAYRTMDEINQERIVNLKDVLGRSGAVLSDDQQRTLARDGKLFGVAKLDRPVKHPNGAIEMPAAWLPEIPEGHPWRSKLSPGDEAYYSYVEERIFKAKLFDPENPDHVKAASEYLKKRHSQSPEFVGWTYAQRTECEKKKYDAFGTGVTDAAAPPL